MALDLLCSSSISSWVRFGHFCRWTTPITRHKKQGLSFSGITACWGSCYSRGSHFSRIVFTSTSPSRVVHRIPRAVEPSSSDSTSDNQNFPPQQSKAPFGYTRKDVLLIGLGVTALGVGLKSGLEFIGVDSLQAGNVVQLVLVLGLTVGWIATYIFRVSNKDMTYAQQLRDYEKKVMEKRLEGLSEGELEALLEDVEKEKRRLGGNRPVD